MTKSISREERLYDLYKTFFDKAERERRWNPLHDVPYDALRPDLPEAIILAAETFCCVESYLPDYVASGINVVRPYFGQAWFAANWAYEESKHSLALMEYLLRSGRRTPTQMFDLQAKLMSNTWKMPFDTARRMTIYGCFQEQATAVIYLRHEQVARSLGDTCLATIYRLNARDEIAHCRFYEDVVRVLLEEDREGTLRDIALVARQFEMPGVGIVPDYDARIQSMREETSLDRDVFLKKVFFPVLKYIGITRHDLLSTASSLPAAPSSPAAPTPAQTAPVSPSAESSSAST